MPKSVIAPYHLVNAQSMGANITSSAVNVQYLDNIGLEFVWTGSPTGTFAVQASVSGTNYIDLTISNPSLTAPAGSSGSMLVNLFNLPFVYFRVTYTRTSGTGTLDVWITTKEE